MILGRPTNQWAGLVTAALALAQVLIITLRPDLDPAQVATILGSVGAFLGVFIAFIAGQPPTVAGGGQFQVQTPAGAPNAVATADVSPATGNVVTTTITPGPTS